MAAAAGNSLSLMRDFEVFLATAIGLHQSVSWQSIP